MTQKQLKEQFGIDRLMSLRYYIAHISIKPVPIGERWILARSYQKWVSKRLTKEDLVNVFGFKNSIHHKSYVVYPGKNFQLLFEDGIAYYNGYLDGCRLFFYDDLIRQFEKCDLQLELKE